MRSVAPAAAVVVMTACASQPGGHAGQPAVAQVAVDELPSQPSHVDDHVDPSPRLPADLDDPVVVAVASVVDGLEGLGFDVADLGAEPIELTPDLATVRVAVTQVTRSGASRVSMAVYECALRRGPDGRWAMVTSRQVA